MRVVGVEFKGVRRSSKASRAVSRDCERGTLGGEMRRERKSLRNGVHHADAVVWGAVRS